MDDHHRTISVIVTFFIIISTAQCLYVRLVVEHSLRLILLLLLLLLLLALSLLFTLNINLGAGALAV